jgi:hypothetical protein
MASKRLRLELSTAVLSSMRSTMARVRSTRSEESVVGRGALASLTSTAASAGAGGGGARPSSTSASAESRFSCNSWCASGMNWHGPWTSDTLPERRSLT